MDDVPITELKKLDVTRIDAVDNPANGFPVLIMKGLAEPVEKDWAQWDAAHEGGGKGNATAAGDSKASAASAVARAKQTIADHKAGKKVSAADLKNAHDVHEAHLAHEAKLKAEGKSTTAAKPKAATAKPAAAKPAAKPVAAKKDLAKAGARDCPKCGHGHDADHKGNTCTECGADLPASDDAEKSAVDIIVKAVTDGQVDQAPDIDLGHQIMGLLARAIIGEAQEIAAGSYGEVMDVELLNCAASMISRWVGREAAPGEDDDMMLMQSAAKAVEWTGEQWADWVAALEKVIPGAHLLPPGDTSKSQIAKEGADVDTETQTGDLEEVVKAADAKAAALEKRVTDQESVIKALEGRLAKVEAAPVLGGPVMSVVRPKTAADGEDHAAVAKRYEDWADVVASPQDADHYRQLAAQERAKIPS